MFLQRIFYRIKRKKRGRSALNSCRRRPISALKDKNGPKGKGASKERFLKKVSHKPASIPRKEEKKTTKGRIFQPKTAPVQAASFTSPKPMPSFFRISQYSRPVAQKISPPALAPQKASQNALSGFKSPPRSPKTVPETVKESGKII